MAASSERPATTTAAATTTTTATRTRQRRYAPKSLGGCLTCRSRHVRCDQLRPRCSACCKASRQCRYAAATSAARSRTGTNSTSPDSGLEHEVIPEADIKMVYWEPPSPSATGRAQTNGPSSSYTSARITRVGCSLTYRRLVTAPGATLRERRALRYFRDVVAEKLAGYFDAGFWTGVLFRVAQGAASLRHAMVALASHWENVVVPGMHIQGWQDWECDDFTLKQYTLAISEMRKSMEQAQRPSTVELLMSNLLFICLEMFQNHYDSALRQLSSGLFLFCEWHATRSRSDAKGEVETQLSHIFNRLLTPSLLFPASRMDKRLLVPELTPGLPDVPAKFDNPDHARDSLNDCMGSIVHGAKSRNERDINKCLDGFSAVLAWSNVFAEFRARDETGLGEIERRSVVLLDMQRLAMCVWATSQCFLSEMEFDRCMDHFSKLVAMGQYLVDATHLTAPQGKVLRYPKFDLGMILPLYFAASRCRDPKLRRQAVELLRRGPRQEGVWNGIILASVAERIIMLEEKGLDDVRECKDVPMFARVRLDDTAILTAEKKVAALFVRLTDDERHEERLYEMIPY